MDAIHLLTEIQRQTKTSALPWNDEYRAWLLNDLKKNIGTSDEKGLNNSIDATVKELYSYQLPTPYESSLHYPILLELLKELYAVKDIVLGNIESVNTDIRLPVIGTANFNNINAYVNPQYNLIVIDRDLYFFLSHITTLIIELVTTKQDDRFVIRPSKLDVQSIIQKIQANNKLCQRFTEVMCSYVLSRGAWPYEQYHYGNEDQHDWHEVITREVLRFVVSHEFAHILLNDTESTPSIELNADLVGAYLCTAAINKNKSLHEMRAYWAMAVAAKTLDILLKCSRSFHAIPHTHPINRIATIYDVLAKAKADSYTMGMVSIIHSIFEILWRTVEPLVKGLAAAWNDGKIKTVDEIRYIISHMP